MSKNQFEGTRQQMEELLAFINEHKAEHGALMPVLHKAQNIYGYLPSEVQKVIAEQLDIPLSEVYGVTTFYAQFSLNPKGKHRISVCLGTACYVKGSDKILAEVERELGIKCGECTADRNFSIDNCRCVGACGLAPVMLVDDDVYGKITPADVKGILEKYRE